MSELTKEYFDEQVKGLRIHAEKLQENLAVMTAHGFENVEHRLVSVSSELGGVSDDVFTTKNNIDHIKNLLAEVNKTLHQIDKRDKEDSDVFAKDIVQIQRDVKQLKLKHA